MTTLRPSWLAIGLLAGYVIAVLSLFLLGADGPDVLILGTLIAVPWIVWPAAFAAWLVGKADDPIKSWGSLILEAAVVGSTVWLSIHLLQNPDPQNGMAFVWLPLVQFGGVLAGWLGLRLGQGLLARARPANT